MAKGLVLYYSSYGHVETMAKAVAEGARSAGASVDIKRAPETAPLEMAKAAHFKLDQSAPVAGHRRVGELRCHHRRQPHALRPHVVADGELPRPGRRLVDARRPPRQSWRCLHLDRDPARRSGSDLVFDH